MANTDGEAANHITYGQMNLINTLRELWMELPMWRRAYLVSFNANLEDLSVINDRLYKAPTNIGDVLEPFFGRTIGRTIEDFIRQEIIIWIEILRAEKAGDTEVINENTQRMYQNADQMAAYLAQVNPYWDEETWKRLFYEYYETTLLEMVDVLSGRNERAITLYESMQNQALNIADYMARGLIAYFTD